MSEVENLSEKEPEYIRVGRAKWSRWGTYLVITIGDKVYSMRKSDIEGKTLESPFASIPVYAPNPKYKNP